MQLLNKKNMVANSVIFGCVVDLVLFAVQRETKFICCNRFKIHRFKPWRGNVVCPPMQHKSERYVANPSCTIHWRHYWNFWAMNFPFLYCFYFLSWDQQAKLTSIYQDLNIEHSSTIKRTYHFRQYTFTWIYMLREEGTYGNCPWLLLSFLISPWGHELLTKPEWRLLKCRENVCAPNPFCLPSPSVMLFSSPQLFSEKLDDFHFALEWGALGTCLC